MQEFPDYLRKEGATLQLGDGARATCLLQYLLCPEIRCTRLWNE
jgi:hypothetical protein